MARKTMDCREQPSESNCTLVISGEENEVLEAAVQHAVSVHGEMDSPELREEIRLSLKEEPAEFSRSPGEQEKDQPSPTVM